MHIRINCSHSLCHFLWQDEGCFSVQKPPVYFDASWYSYRSYIINRKKVSGRLTQMQNWPSIKATRRNHNTCVGKKHRGRARLRDLGTDSTYSARLWFLTGPNKTSNCVNLTAHLNTKTSTNIKIPCLANRRVGPRIRDPHRSYVLHMSPFIQVYHSRDHISQKEFIW